MPCHFMVNWCLALKSKALYTPFPEGTQGIVQSRCTDVMFVQLLAWLAALHSTILTLHCAGALAQSLVRPLYLFQRPQVQAAMQIDSVSARCHIKGKYGCEPGVLLRLVRVALITTTSAAPARPASAARAAAAA